MAEPEEISTTLAATGMICATIVITFILGSITYSCSQPNKIDPNEQANRIIENNKMVSCSRIGGSWMPVRVRKQQQYDEVNMSCVTDKALPLVTKMNLDKE